MNRFCGVLLVCGLAATAGATSINLHSGNGSVGGTDSLITMEVGPIASDFAALTAADFAAARTGPAAFIIASQFWQAGLTHDASAKWIGASADAAGNGNAHGALYAIPFTLAALPAGAAPFSMFFAVDNALGSGTNAGVFINGTALPSTNGIGTFNSGDISYTDSNISSLLVLGQNWLYIDAVNGGGPAGLIFSANLSFTDAPPPTGAAPEPGTLALLGSAMASLVAFRRHLR